jgi:hypothetical protein
LRHDLLFDIVEENDGFTGTIVYSGTKNVGISLSGVIEGVKEIKAFRSLRKTETVLLFFKYFLYVLIGISLVGIPIGYIFNNLFPTPATRIQSKTMDIVDNIFNGAFLLILLVGIIFLLVKMPLELIDLKLNSHPETIETFRIK